MNTEDTAKIVAVLAGYYPGWAPTPESIQLWAKETDPLDASFALDVARDIARTEERWPTLAGFLRRYAERLGVTAPSPSDAWAEVRAAIARTGRSGSVAWSHPAVAQAVAAIGWGALCNSDNADTIRAQFRRFYEEQARPLDREAVASMEIGPPVEQAALPAPDVDPELAGIRRSMELTARRDRGLVCETCGDAGFHDVDGNATACSCPLGATWRDRLSVRALPVAVERTAVPDHLRAFAESHAVCDLSVDRAERTPVVASSVVGDNSAFVEGLRDDGWSEDDIALAVRSVGRVRAD